MKVVYLRRYCRVEERYKQENEWIYGIGIVDNTDAETKMISTRLQNRKREAKETVELK